MSADDFAGVVSILTDAAEAHGIVRATAYLVRSEDGKWFRDGGLNKTPTFVDDIAGAKVFFRKSQARSTVTCVKNMVLGDTGLQVEPTIEEFMMFHIGTTS